MYLLLLLGCLTAEPIAEEMPTTVRKYFERQDEIYVKQIASLEKKIEDLKVRSVGEPLANARRLLAGQLRKAETTLEELKQDRFKPKPHLSLPEKSLSPLDVDDIGFLPVGKLMRTIDDKPLIKVGEVVIVLEVDDPKVVHPVRPFISKDLWIITAVRTDDETLKMYLPKPIGTPFNPYYFVTPIKMSKIEKWRAEYNAQQKAKHEADEETKPDFKSDAGKQRLNPATDGTAK